MSILDSTVCTPVPTLGYERQTPGFELVLQHWTSNKKFYLPQLLYPSFVVVGDHAQQTSPACNESTHATQLLPDSLPIQLTE